MNPLALGCNFVAMREQFGWHDEVTRRVNRKMSQKKFVCFTQTQLWLKETCWYLHHSYLNVLRHSHRIHLWLFLGSSSPYFTMTPNKFPSLHLLLVCTRYGDLAVERVIHTAQTPWSSTVVEDQHEVRWATVWISWVKREGQETSFRLKSYTCRCHQWLPGYRA